MGYYIAAPLIATKQPSIQSSLKGILIFPTISVADAARIMKPFENALTAADINYADQVFSHSFTIHYSSYSSSWPSIASAQSVGFSVRLGSRLFDRTALTADPGRLNRALRTSTPVPYQLIGHLVAGPGPRNAKIPGGSNAVLPAWREAYAHIVLPRVWGQGDLLTAKLVQDDLRNMRVPALVSVAPNTGAYVNEADPTTPGDWQTTFWGSNYPRLKRVKDRWDPKGVFFCRLCVGFEDWVVSGGDAVGQNEGSICRV